jgi:hypothetical protein
MKEDQALFYFGWLTPKREENVTTERDDDTIIRIFFGGHDTFLNPLKWQKSFACIYRERINTREQVSASIVSARTFDTGLFQKLSVFRLYAQSFV